MLKEGRIDCGKFEEVSVRARQCPRGAPGCLEGLRRLLDRGLSSLGATFPHLPSSSTPSLQTPKSDWTLVAFPETFIRHVTQFSP